MTNRNENGVGFAQYASTEKSHKTEDIVVSADTTLDGFKSQLIEALEFQRQQEISPSQETSVDQINEFLHKIEQAKDFNDFLASLGPSLGNVLVPKTDIEKREIGFNVEKPKPAVEIS